MKDKKGIIITNTLEKNLKESNRKLNKIWVDKSSEFYIFSMKLFLHSNNIEIYSKRFIRTLANKIYKYMTSVSKNLYNDKLDDKVNKYNNIYHRTIKMRPVDINPNMHIDFNKENNKEGPKFKVVSHVRISNYKNIFANGHVPNGSNNFSVIAKIKNTVPWTYVISDINGEEIVGTFYEKELEKTNQK